MLSLRRAESGDTMVEVIISIAVVGSVLVSAFQITNMNTQNVQQAQEYGQATRLVQSQIEYLRNGTFRPAIDKCFKSDGKATVTAAECQVSSAGLPSTEVPYYLLSITSTAISGGVRSYTIKADWDSATGNGIANITMYYRL